MLTKYILPNNSLLIASLLLTAWVSGCSSQPGNTGTKNPSPNPTGDLVSFEQQWSGSNSRAKSSKNEIIRTDEHWRAIWAIATIVAASLILAVVAAIANTPSNVSAQEQSKVSVEEFADLYATLSVEMAEYGQEHLNWKDGADNSHPLDSGRGISDYDPHHGWAMKNDRMVAVRDIAERFREFSDLEDRKDYAKLYAKLSQHLAKLGGKHLNWVNGQDSKVDGDSSRGITTYKHHYDFALIPKNHASASQNVIIRLLEVALAGQHDQWGSAWWCVKQEI